MDHSQFEEYAENLTYMYIMGFIAGVCVGLMFSEK